MKQLDTHVRLRQKHRVRRSEQSAFTPQRTSTPSPTFDRREAFPAATQDVPLPATPPQTSRPDGLQPRPIFEPVVASNNQLPLSVVRLPVAPAPIFHFQKPDVISDVNDNVAEPLRPAPRTDRHRQRTSRTSQGPLEEHQLMPDEPVIDQYGQRTSRTSQGPLEEHPLVPDKPLTDRRRQRTSRTLQGPSQEHPLVPDEPLGDRQRQRTSRTSQGPSQEHQLVPDEAPTDGHRQRTSRTSQGPPKEYQLVPDEALTDPHRQRTSRISQGPSQEHHLLPDEPHRPALADQEDSTSDTSSSGSDGDESDSTASGDSGEFLLVKSQRQARSSERQPISEIIRENLPPDPSVTELRVRVCSLSTS